MTNAWIEHFSLLGGTNVVLAGNLPVSSGEVSTRIIVFNEDGSVQSATPAVGTFFLNSSRTGELALLSGDNPWRLEIQSPSGIRRPGFNAPVFHRIGSKSLTPFGDSLLVVGALGTGTGRTAVERLTIEGRVDTSVASVAFPDSRKIEAFAVDSDSRVYLSGPAPGASASLVRFRANGEPDPDFKELDIFSQWGQAVSTIVVEPNGQIYAGGSFDYLGGRSKSKLARLNNDGSIDDSFDAVDVLKNQFSFVETVLVQSNRIYVAGSIEPTSGKAPIALMSLNMDGSLTSDFQPVVGSYYSQIYRAGAAGKRRVCVCGSWSSLNGNPSQSIAMINPDGSLDSSFVAQVRSASGAAVIFDFLQAPYGKIIIAGKFDSVGGHKVKNLARLNADGSFDTTFAAPEINSVVTALVWGKGNDFFVTGNFTKAGEVERIGFVKFAPAPRLEFKALGDSAFGFGISSEAGKQLLIERSTDLRIWTGILQTSSGTGQAAIPYVPDSGREFYRVLQQ